MQYRHFKATVCAMLFIVAQQAIAGAAPAPIEELLKQWRAVTSSVISSRIRYRELAQGGDALKSLTVDDLSLVLKSNDLGRDPDNLRGFAAATMIDASRYKDPWGVQSFYHDGQRSRDEHGSLLFVFDGQNKILRNRSSSGNEHISINGQPGGEIASVTLSDLMFYPDNFRCLQQNDLSGRTTIKSSNEDKVVYEIVDLKDPSSLVIAVDENGWPYRVEHRGNGVVVNAWWYQGYRVVEQGTQVPYATVSANFSGGRLNLLIARAFEDAKFNVAVDETLFKVPVKAGTGIHDFRSEGDPRRRAQFETDDVTRLQAVPMEKLEQKRDSSQLTWSRLLILANVVVLVTVISFLAWRKRGGNAS